MLTHNIDIPRLNMSDLCESIADGDHNPPPKSDNGIPFITISSITENKDIDFSNTMFVPNEYYDGLDAKRKAQKDDILYTVVGSFGTPVHIREDIPFVFQRHIAILRPKQSIVKSRYLYHAMQSRDFYKQADSMARGAAQRTISLSSLGKMSVYVPALEIQDKIVDVLDNFEAICNDLKIGLPAEINARKKQYEYYRDMLLTFPECSNTILTDRQTDRQTDISGLITLYQYVYGFAFVSLGNIATEIYRGAGIKRDEVTEEGIPCVRYGEIYTMYDIAFSDCVSHTKEDVVSNPKYFEHGDIIFAITGESVEEISKSIAYLGHEKCMAGGDTVVMKHNQDPRYMSYVLSTTSAQEQKSKGRVKSKVVHSSVPALKEIIIPLPSVERQKQIADILDNFHRLCNDIAVGIPAEIEARKKQYEYYRDKLLDFKELSE